MNHAQIVQRRLVQHQLATASFTQPHELVGWMGAMQAQDFLGSLWAVGVRVPGATERMIEAAVGNGSIVRTWPMRGTIHLMAAADVRWMVGLMAPRILKNSQGRLRELGIDATTLATSADVLARALEGGRKLTRPELYDALNEAGIAASGQRGIHILGQLSMQQVLCIGPRAGKQPTFVLLDEWVPDVVRLSREEALTAVALRYFTSHGPATRYDFAFWTGLSMTDAKAAIASAAASLRREEMDGQEYYSSRDVPDAPLDSGVAYLLPPFDEWLVGYRDRTATVIAEDMAKVVPGANGIFFPIVVMGGRVVGIWKRAFKRGAVVMTFTRFRPWTDAEEEAVQRAAEGYAAFHELPLLVEATV